MDYTIQDNTGKNLDFFLEMTKYAGYIRKSYLARHLSLYELYKQTMDLPGSVAEFGIYNGSTFFFLARLIEIFHHAQHEVHHSSSRHLYGFDRFEVLSARHAEDETQFCDIESLKEGGMKSDKESFFKVFESMKQQCSVGNRLHVIDGDVHETFPAFQSSYPGVKFCFVLLDLDLYSATKVVLDRVFEHMVPGGIIVFDEYGFPELPGETKAVDEFVKRHGLSLKAFNWTFAPGAYSVVS